MTKTVHRFAPVSGEYLGPVALDASDLSPREPGVYLIPGNCTEDAPPEAPAGHVAVRRGLAWEVVEDHRGETVYVAGTAVRVAHLGPLPEGATTAPPTPTAPSEADLLAALRTERDARLAAALALLDRHRNQADFGLPTTLSTAQAKAWAVYAQALRDLPEITTDPAVPDWPLPPQ
ncbi:putative Tail fiber assembly protein [uncultured Alphaproteobacteria bacterium]|uniref:Putative Tail fiber assembly protein n=1 Tax=uncultured Alphaproteobacteria bacterium TaxID=91750 RepID=A0A212J404_9PROT|nr:putative Tail fiber assembly protein [uncultured Alphaproteobacteria bacterium]